MVHHGKGGKATTHAATDRKPEGTEGAEATATAPPAAARQHPEAGQPHLRRHPPRRPLGVHHVPRLRGAVPGAHLVRRQDRRHAPQPGHGARASSRRSSRAPSRPSRSTATRGTSRAWTAAAWSDGLGVADHERQADGAGALLGGLRGELRRPRQEDRARDGQAAAAGRRRLRHPRQRGELHRRPRAPRRQRDAVRHAGRGQRRDHQRLQGAGRRHDRGHHLPALLQHAEERVPRLRPEARGRAPHRLSARARGRGQARARRTRSRGGSSTTTAATWAGTTGSTIRRARSSAASPASSWSSPSTGPSSGASAAAPAARRCSWRSRTTTA